MSDYWIGEGRRARRETAQVDFKAEFHKREWPEVIKDVVAMANSGGGAIVFGVLDNGRTSRANLDEVAAVDPAQLADQIQKYTGSRFGRVAVGHARRQGGARAVVFAVESADFPLIFEREGAYELEPGARQKVAFRPGMVYVRHGAKSAPATNADLREILERVLAEIRDDWLEGIAKVVETPADAEVRTVRVSGEEGDLRVQFVDDPTAPVFGQLHPDRTHPHRRKELLEVVNDRLPDGMTINGHDIQCVRGVHDIDARREFVYRPKFSSPQYSEAFADWLAERATEDWDFFQRARRGER